MNDFWSNYNNKINSNSQGTNNNKQNGTPNYVLRQSNKNDQVSFSGKIKKPFFKTLIATLGLTSVIASASAKNTPVNQPINIPSAPSIIEQYETDKETKTYTESMIESVNNITYAAPKTTYKQSFITSARNSKGPETEIENDLPEGQTIVPAPDPELSVVKYAPPEVIEPTGPIEEEPTILPTLAPEGQTIVPAPDPELSVVKYAPPEFEPTEPIIEPTILPTPAPEEPIVVKYAPPEIEPTEPIEEPTISPTPAPEMPVVKYAPPEFEPTEPIIEPTISPTPAPEMPVVKYAPPEFEPTEPIEEPTIEPTSAPEEPIAVKYAPPEYLD